MHTSSSGTSCPRALRCCAPPTTSKEASRMLGCGVCTLILGLILIIVAAVVPPTIMKMVDDGLAESLIIDDDQSSGHEGFTTNRKAPTIMELYVMDIINAEDILKKGAAPILVERGPYVYRIMKERYNLSWSQDGEILEWREHEYAIFDEEASIESDTYRNITSIYMPFVAVRANLAGVDSTLETRNQMLIMFLFYVPLNEYDRYFTTKTARELVFGYDDPLMTYLNSMDSSVEPYFPGFVFNGTSRYATEHRKDTTNLFSFWTGKNHPEKMRQWIKWKNMTHIDVCSKSPCPPNAWQDAWATQEAGVIKGSDGSAFQSGVTSDRKLDVWFGSFYRSLSLEYKKDVEFRGVDLLRFGLPAGVMNNVTLTPANSVYYQYGPTGFFNLTSLANDAPLFVSNAQFRGSDVSIASGMNVSWIQHDSDFYDTFFDVEPISGAGFHASASSQLNVAIGPLPGMSTLEDENVKETWFPNMTTTYIPLFYAKQEAGIPQEDADQFTSKVYGALFLADIALYLGAIGGSISLMMGIAFTGMAVRTKRDIKHWGETTKLMKPDGHGDTVANADVDTNGNDGTATDNGHANGFTDARDHDDTTSNNASKKSAGSASEEIDISYQRD